MPARLRNFTCGLAKTMAIAIQRRRLLKDPLRCVNSMPKKDYDLAALSEGIPHMPRRLTARELLVDHLFFYMHVTSRYAFILGGIIGWNMNHLEGVSDVHRVPDTIA